MFIPFVAVNPVGFIILLVIIVLLISGAAYLIHPRFGGVVLMFFVTLFTVEALPFLLLLLGWSYVVSSTIEPAFCLIALPLIFIAIKDLLRIFVRKMSWMDTVEYHPVFSKVNSLLCFSSFVTIMWIGEIEMLGLVLIKLILFFVGLAYWINKS